MKHYNTVIDDYCLHRTSATRHCWCSFKKSTFSALLQVTAAPFNGYMWQCIGLSDL